MELSEAQESPYANIPNESTVDFKRMKKSFKDVRSDRKWKTGMIVAVAIIAFIATGLSLAALVKIRDIQTEMAALRQMQADPGWYAPNNGYQYTLSRDPQTWNNSRAWCKEMGGDLATVGMRTYNIRRNIVVALLMKDENAWIGLNSITHEGNFVWIDGVVTTKSNVTWSKGQPNSYKGGQDRGNPRYGMNDIACNQAFRGICEKPLIKI